MLALLITFQPIRRAVHLWPGRRAPLRLRKELLAHAEELQVIGHELLSLGRPEARLLRSPHIVRQEVVQSSRAQTFVMQESLSSGNRARA